MVELSSQSNEMAREHHHLTVDQPDLNFTEASVLAKVKARQINSNAMMLAWYNAKTQEGFPDYDCGGRDKPPWEVFADARGANLTIDVNDGDYLFFYLKL